MGKKCILFWVLADQSKQRTIYFREWTRIGPLGTKDLKLAEHFRTRRESMRSMAYSFSLAFYGPMPIRKGTT